MNREKQLIKNTAIVAIGQICTKFISFFLLPLYTAILSAEEFGTVDLLNTYISLLLPLIFLQLDQAIFRFLIDARSDEDKKKILISTTIYTMFIQSVIYIIVFLLIGKYINNEYKYFLATNVIATMLSNIFLQLSRGLGDNTTYSVGGLITGAGTIILNVLFLVVLKLGAYGMLIASLIANTMCSLFIFIRKKIYKYLNISNVKKTQLLNLWKYSIPLIPNQLSWWIINASDRTLVTYFLGIGSNGIYSAANKFSSIVISFFSIINITWTESAALHFNDKDNSSYFTKIFNDILKIFVSLSFAIIAFMPFVFKLLITGDGYKDAYYQIPILMVATIFNICVSLFGSVYVALKKSKEIAKASIYSAIINICVNLLLIKFIGLYAASISTLLAYLAMAIYRYFDIQKYIKIKIDLAFLIISIILGISLTISYYIRNTMICVFMAIITILLTIIINRNIIISSYTILKNKLLKKRINN